MRMDFSKSYMKILTFQKERHWKPKKNCSTAFISIIVKNIIEISHNWLFPAYWNYIVYFSTTALKRCIEFDYLKLYANYLQRKATAHEIFLSKHALWNIYIQTCICVWGWPKKYAIPEVMPKLCDKIQKN